MSNLKKFRILVVILFFLQGCGATGGVTDAALTIVALPFKVVGVAIAAAIGAAAGMGMMPNLDKFNE
jgi:hypothetical protein